MEISETGLMAAVVVQSLLAGISTWYAGYAVKRIKNGSIVLQMATIGFQFAVSLICRFAAVRGSVYTDSVMTEGLGLSLFVLFMTELYLYIITERRSHAAGAMFLSFLLISLRKQMLITIFIMGAVFAWYYVIRSQKLRKFCMLVLLMISVIAAGKLFDRTYNYAVRGEWIEHCHNSMGFLCVLLYSSDAERDSGLFTDETLRTLYLEMMEQAEEQQILYPYAEPGWLSVSSHFADSYDAIGYGIINPVVEGYVRGNFDYPEVQAALKYDEICGGMVRVLLKQDKMPLVWIWACNIWKGFVNSVARASDLLNLYAVAAYLLMGVMALYLIVQKKKLRKMERQVQGAAEYRDRIEQIGRSLTFAFIVMVGIAVNSMAVGLTIFTQPRYMLYSMGFFYTAGFMLLYDTVSLVAALNGGALKER
ncbi:MAG: hypothetical protein NC341_11805 [Blautia sp.]|nr:hypothetical protein [Blautia sp.]MCM1202250.1 hypothetical protein [Bacteroides fragilis]